MNNSAIGVLDSGMGGLSVWRELKRLMPEESLLYFADRANCPYGNKSKQEIQSCVCAATERLIEHGVKMIVVACNTATSVAINHLRASYDIPFVGLEPAVKPAALSSKTGVIGVLATESSLHGEKFHNSVERYGEMVKIIAAVGEGFVEIVEAHDESSARAHAVVESVVEPILAQGVDRLVLGCTHYPFLRAQIERVIGDRAVEVIDPAVAVAERVSYLLDECGIRSEAGHMAQRDFLTSADESYLAELMVRSERL